ncbi:MAG: carbohydrate binding domain-containing protein, partial [Lachnospiraceae bacterium]|nr:carbohydrate binding domain-containing protein [Lachnospiraceae bacterium]
MIAGQEDQSYYVDYVRVYQKDKAVYEAQEEEAEAPVHEVVYRQPDAQGNYVVNGDFSKELKAADAEGDNFELHLEDDGAGSTWKVENNQVKITPAAAGSQNHSVQLKQTGIPMYKDCEYEISYDAYADEARTIVVDIEGPDRGWTRYFKDTTQELTTTKKTYTHTFTMEEKTDPNGSLEFNLGNQGSTAAVYISNVKVIVKSGEAVVKPEEKTVRADGNYIYNGGFDQGNKRLGYWEFDEKDAENIRVIKDGGKQLKVTVQDSPITLRQADLPRIIAGEYEIGFDAYMEEGSDADAMTVIVSDRKFEPQLSKTSQHFAKDLLMRENVESKDAWVEITFSKPGTYYLDNVMLCEALLLKNGSFKAGLAGYTPYIYNNNLASYVVDNINNPSTFVMTVNDTGADDAANDWYIQLNQDGIKLEKGKTYKVSFKAKSSIERQIKYSLQQFEGNWTNYSGTDTPIDLTTAWQTISKEFTMTNETDNATRFNITMGSIGGTRITEKHEVYIDDIELVEVGEAKTPEQETADQEAAGQVNQLIAAIGTVTLNDESKAKIDAADDAYEALTLDQQKVITDEEYAVLADAKKTYAALKKAAEDKAAADAVKALINAIGTVAFTDESKAKIDAASQAYETLTDDQKALLKDEYKVLTAANETYAELKKKAETPITIPIEENKDGKKDESKEDPKPSTPVVTGSTKDADGSLSDHDGVAEVGETQVTKQGTITVTGKDTAEFAPSAAELKKKTSTVPATGIVDGQTVKVTALASKAYAKANNLKKLVLGKNITTLPANALTGATNLETVDASKAQIKTFKAKSFAKNKKLKVLKVNGNKIKSVKKNCFAKKSNNKKTKVYIYAANKTRFNKVVKMFKAAGLKKATYKFKKAK